MQLISGVARDLAFAQIQNTLKYENFLGKCVAARVRVGCGSLYSVHPQGLPINSVTNFAWGTGGGHDKAIAERLLRSLSLSKNRFMIVDDVMADASTNTTFPSIVRDGEVFHYATGSSDADELEKLVWESAVSWHFLAVLFESHLASSQVTQKLHAGDCVGLGRVCEIVVGAFDGEGFVHWLPDS